MTWMIGHCIWIGKNSKTGSEIFGMPKAAKAEIIDAYCDPGPYAASGGDYEWRIFMTS